MAKGAAAATSSRASSRGGGKLGIEWNMVVFKTLVLFTALFYLIYKGINLFYRAYHSSGDEYLIVMAGLFGLAVAGTVARQFKEPDKNIHLMQVGSLGMAAFVITDAFMPGGDGYGIALLQGFLAFDLVMLHPAREKLNHFW